MERGAQCPTRHPIRRDGATIYVNCAVDALAVPFQPRAQIRFGISGEAAHKRLLNVHMPFVERSLNDKVAN